MTVECSLFQIAIQHPLKTTDVLEADLISERDEIHGMKLDDYIFLL